jgi:uncharacterized protein with HEPN domain
MFRKNEKSFLIDIKNSAEKIQKYTLGKPYKEFIKDDLLVDGVIRNLEIIGEAVKNLSSDFKNNYSHVEWRKIAGIRDILIHDYFGIDYEILWGIIKDKIPELLKQINEILVKINNEHY